MYVSSENLFSLSIWWEESSIAQWYGGSMCLQWYIGSSCQYPCVLSHNASRTPLTTTPVMSIPSPARQIGDAKQDSVTRVVGTTSQKFFV